MQYNENIKDNANKQDSIKNLVFWQFTNEIPQSQQ